jgi:signal transduction histidine kinase
MPLSDQIGAPHGAAAMVAAGLLFLAVCLGVAWRRVGSASAAKGQRGRLREFGWCAAMVAVTVVLAFSLVPGFWAVAALVLAGLVLLLRPGLAGWITALLLIVLGLVGIGLARELGWGPAGSGRYGLAPAGTGSGQASLVLAQAYVFMALGGWLGWRQLRARPVLGRLVLGKMAAREPKDQLWGLLLLLVAVAAAAISNSDAWAPVAIVLVIVCAMIVRRAPGLAARATALGLIGLGLAGLLLFKSWSDQGEVAIAAVPKPSSAPGATSPPVLTTGHPYMRYGLVDLQNQSLANLAMVEAFGLLGLGCWLIPRSFPTARRALGLVTDAQFTSQVQQLTESRAVVADTAAADVRRLERDLHDGAQARLVALGMNLRAAERLIHSSPEAAAALVAEARETSARALTELRELVRGVHPPVLADRGLADAVRALALDSPLAVETDVDLPGRPPAPIETACYFAIAELLANAGKHSGARQARISVRYLGNLLRIEVSDTGLGGADPVNGSGLAGVEKRLAAFDGILAISSPPGGPTIVVLEVPCALSLPRISSF